MSLVAARKAVTSRKYVKMTESASALDNSTSSIEPETEEKQVEFTPRPGAGVPDDLADLDLDD